MKNHAFDPIIVVRYKTSRCKECYEKLHKSLRAIEGIHELAIDPKKELVLIRGNIDPFLLVKEIGKTGKPVELIFYDKEPKIEEDEHQHHHKRSTNCCKEKHPNYDDDHGNPKSRQDGSEKHPHFCCPDNDLHPPKKEANNDEAHKDHESPKMEKDGDNKIEEDEHQHHHKRSANCCKEKHPNHDDDHGNPKSRQDGSEKHPHFCCPDNDLHPPKKEDSNDEAHKDHEAPKKEKDDEEDIFKHPYFRFQRSASTNQRVPSWGKKNTSGYHADYQKQAHFDSHNSRYETSNPQCSRFFGGESASYDHYHSRMPPPSSYPYDFGDYENFTHYFNDYNPSSCNVM